MVRDEQDCVGICIDKYSMTDLFYDCLSLCQFGWLCVIIESFFACWETFFIFLHMKCTTVFKKLKYTPRRYFKDVSKTHSFLKKVGLIAHPESMREVNLLDPEIEDYESKIKTLEDIHLIQELAFVCKLNSEKHVNVILNYIKEKSNMEQLVTKSSDDVKYTCLDHAFYYGGHDVVKCLLELGISDLTLHKGKYNATCLHLAILQNSPELVKACLEPLSDSDRYELLHGECDGKLVQTLYRSSSIKARLPLNMAVLVSNDKIVDILMEKGAELDRQDSDGHSVIHTIVLMSNKYKEEANHLYSLILDKYMMPWWKKTLEAKGEKLNIDSEMEAGYYLLNQKTRACKMTPMVLAAHIGSKMMLDRIINTELVYRFTLIKGGPVGMVYYDISDIDAGRFGYDTDDSRSSSHSESLSVVEVLLTTEDDRSLECLDIPLFEDILSTKWNNYFLHYVWVVTSYFTFMGLLTSTMFEINIPERFISGNKSEHVVDSPVVSGRHWAVLVGAVFILMYGLVSLISSTWTFLTRHLKTNIWRDVSLSIFCVCLSIMVICRFALYLSGNPLQVPVFGIAAVLGWCFSIFFLNGFRPTALFSVMVVRLLFRDFLVFGLCYFFISCGFAAAIAANMNYRSSPPFPYSDWKFTFFTLFRVILGLMDIDDLFDTKELPTEVYGYNIVIFTIYFLVSAVFLLNMLIASMSNSYCKISEKGHLFWKKL